jgi:asparagine synthase (glutamine-hydrolysing)
VLSGEGADEVFAGYAKHSFARAPGALRGLARILGSGNLAGLAGMAGLDRRRALVAARALAEPREVDRLVQWFSYLDRSDLHRVLPGLDWSGANWEQAIASQSEALARIDDPDGLLRMQILDCLTWLPGNMLERGDRMTMAEGLEVRPPFLDKELAAFGLALPPALKVRGSTGKWIVRQWARELVPDDIITRKKWGFRTPLRDWFRGPMKDFLIDHISAKHGLCQEYADAAEVRKLVDDHVAGKIDAGETLWTILSAEVWYQNVYRPGQGEARANAA